MDLRATPVNTRGAGGGNHFQTFPPISSALRQDRGPGTFQLVGAALTPSESPTSPGLSRRGASERLGPDPAEPGVLWRSRGRPPAAPPQTSPRAGGACPARVGGRGAADGVTDALCSPQSTRPQAWATHLGRRDPRCGSRCPRHRFGPEPAAPAPRVPPREPEPTQTQSRDFRLRGAPAATGGPPHVRSRPGAATPAHHHAAPSRRRRAEAKGAGGPGRRASPPQADGAGTEAGSSLSFPGNGGAAGELGGRPASAARRARMAHHPPQGKQARPAPQGHSVPGVLWGEAGAAVKPGGSRGPRPRGRCNLGWRLGALREAGQRRHPGRARTGQSSAGSAVRGSDQPAPGETSSCHKDPRTPPLPAGYTPQGNVLDELSQVHQIPKINSPCFSLL